MKHEEAVKIMDQMENCLVRAEMAKKDLDLIVALRALYKLYEEVVRHGEEKALPRE